jgi:small subunit ribosomal protein S5
MTAKEIQTNKDTEAQVEVSIPATGVDAGAVVAAASDSKVTPGRKMRGDSARRGSHSGPSATRGGRPGGRDGAPRERVKPEFDSKIIDIRRVTRVTTGGRRMNFSVAVVAGDRKGRVGVGLGKSIDTASAVDKATRDAKKNLIKVPLSAGMTIPHAVEAKYASARIMVFPARGRGIVAGSSARAVIELAGIKDICAKFLSGSKNRLNNARAAVEALKKLSKNPRPGRVQAPTKSTK